MNKLGTELANAWMKKTLVDLNGFSENEIPKNRDEAYKALNLFYEELDKKTVGWKIGAVAKEVQKEEGNPIFLNQGSQQLKHQLQYSFLINLFLKLRLLVLRKFDETWLFRLLIP